MNKDQRADEFLTDFKNLADRTGYDDVALVRMLQQSLVMVPSLLEKILQLRKRPEDQEEQGSYRPETLEEWYTTVGDFDRAWRQAHARTQQVKKEKEGTSSSSSRPSNNNQARRQDSRPPPGPPPGYRPPGPPPPPRGPAGSFAPRPRRPNQWANQGQLNTSRPTNGNQWPRTTRDATGITYGGMGQPMDLSRVDTRDMRDVECYNCGKKGHMQRDCRSPRRQRNGQSQPMQARQADVPTLRQVFTGMSDGALNLFATAIQEAQSLGTNSNNNGRQGFRRNRR